MHGTTSAPRLKSQLQTRSFTPLFKLNGTSCILNNLCHSCSENFTVLTETKEVGIALRLGCHSRHINGHRVEVQGGTKTQRLVGARSMERVSAAGCSEDEGGMGQRPKAKHNTCDNGESAKGRPGNGTVAGRERKRQASFDCRDEQLVASKKRHYGGADSVAHGRNEVPHEEVELTLGPRAEGMTR